MPNRTSALETLTLLLPVTAHCDCRGSSKIINLIFVPATEEDSFFEGWGRGSEDAETDSCTECKSLGVLEDARNFLFVDCDGLENAVFSLRMNLKLVEVLSRLIQEYREERASGEKIFLSIDAPLLCAEDFHIFRLSPNGDNDFSNNDWDFNNHPLVETNKVVIVSEKGIKFSCDVSTRGEGRKDLGVITTRWFSLEDLSEINGWLVERGSEEEKKAKKPRLADEYEDGVCPDCQEEIPKKAKYGDGCTNCGHVFNPPSEDDEN